MAHGEISIGRQVGRRVGREPNKRWRELILRAFRHERRGLNPAEVIEALEAREKRSLSPEDLLSIRRVLSYEATKPDGSVIRMEDGYRPRSRVETRLKQRIMQELSAYRFRLKRGEIVKPKLETKDEIRDFHSPARLQKYRDNKAFLEENEHKLLENFAEGNELDLGELWPRIELVEAGTEASDLFRFGTLLWSVPVSQGFGRRVRFLVRDEHTGKLMGLFALGDPVFNLSCRDDWVGWNHHDRAKRLYNVMDVFVLGSVPPYNMLLGGKLVAMLAASNEVRRIIQRRYRDSETVIQEKNKNSRLALLTTGSALGKSALYDRIRFHERLLYQKIGESKGWGHFHLNHGLFDELKLYLDATDEGKSSNRFGAGPNWKMRTARGALNHLGLPGDLLHHGIRREIYAVPLAANFDKFLRGEHSRLEAFDLPFDSLTEHWKSRWLAGRAERKPEFKDFGRKEILARIHGAEKTRTK